MQAHRRSVVPSVPAVRATTVVLFLTGGLVGVMAYYGSVTPFVWVIAVLLGVQFHDRLPRSAAAWRSVATAAALVVCGGLLGAIAYYGALEWTPLFAGACLVALALVPAGSD
jgi:hypothetical protein